MRRTLLAILCCPHCSGRLGLQADAHDGDDVTAGRLRCDQCGASYPIRDGIPRFTPEGYSTSFGMQWKAFRREQIDSCNGTHRSRDRFRTETGWTAEKIAGRWVLDAGCGAGRFLDIASGDGAQAVGVDLSEAVDAARATLGARPNVHLVQASLLTLPFAPAAFDHCYCIGVLQHTPDPGAALRALPQMLKPGGELAVTIYENRKFTKITGKYLVRPLTRRLPPGTLMRAVRIAAPLLFPLTDVLYRLPLVRRGFRALVPFANYVEMSDLPRAERYRWSVLDTFDMLAPRYDQPQRESTVRQWLADAGMVAVRRLPNSGLNLVAKAPAAAAAAIF